MFNMVFTSKMIVSILFPFCQIEGTFRVDKPPVLLGYEHDSTKRNQDGDIEVSTSETTHTYISLFVTIQPPLTPAEPVREKVMCLCVCVWARA